MTIDHETPEDTAGASAPVGRSGFLGRVLKGTGAMALSSVVGIATQLAVVPAAITAWGASRYGEWVVLSGAITVFQLADLGLQTYVVNSICASYVKGNLTEFHETLRDGLAVQTRIVGGLIACLWAVLWLSPINQWLSLQGVSRQTAALVLGILSFDLLISIPVGVVAGVYRATGRFARNIMMGVAQKLALLLLTIMLLYFQLDFVWLAAAKLLVTLSGIGWLMYDFPRLYPWLRIRVGGANLRRGFAMLLPGALFLLVPAAEFATNQVSLMITQHYSSGVQVAELSTHRTIFNSAQMAANFLLMTMWPELTVLYARDEQHDMRRVHDMLTRINCFVVLLVVAGVILGSEWLYPLWTRKTLHFDGVLAGLLAVETLCWGYWSVSSMVLMSMNRPAFSAKAAALNGAIAAGLGFALIPRMGIRGAAIASLTADVSVYVWFLPMTAAVVTGGTYKAFIAGPTRKIVLALAAPVLLLWVAMINAGNTLPIRVAIFFAAAVALMLGALMVFERSEREAFGSLFLRLAKTWRDGRAAAGA